MSLLLFSLLFNLSLCFAIHNHKEFEEQNKEQIDFKADLTIVRSNFSKFLKATCSNLPGSKVSTALELVDCSFEISATFDKTASINYTRSEGNSNQYRGTFSYCNFYLPENGLMLSVDSNQVQFFDCYFQAIDEMRTINGAKSGIALEDILRDKFNEKQKELTSSYGKDVLDVLSLENPEMAFLNSQGNRPELFQEKTLEFMKKAYITRECANEYNKIAKMSPADYKSTYEMQTEKTFIEKIKSAVDKIKSFITHKPEKTTEDTNNKNNDFERVM